MERTSLVEKLELVAPALSAQDLIPIMSHFCFTGTHVFAYNDQIGISTPCKTDFAGALPGATLLGLLKNSRAKDVIFEGDDIQVTVRAASAEWVLGYLPVEDFVFEMPKADAKAVLPVPVADFMVAIGACMKSVNHDTSIPDQLGVTLIPDGKALHLYATNDSTLTHASVKLAGAASFERAILSAPFCAQMAKLASDNKTLQLEVLDDQVMLVSGSTLLCGRLVDSQRPLDYASVMAHEFPDVSKAKLAPIPSKLRLIIERAMVISESKQAAAKTVITVKDGRARFVSRSDKGEVTDVMQVGSEQPDVTVKVEPRFIRNGLAFFDHMLLTESCVVMSKGSIVYLISATDG